LIFIVFLNSGCYKFEGDQTIPAYIRIDTVLINSYYPEEGSNSSNITDVWIYVNDNIEGIYELPAVIPVLANGTQKLDIRPGIKINGISSTRVPYPFYKPLLYENFNFVPDSVTNLKNQVTTYFPDLTFAWMEDFESSSISLEESPASDTIIQKTEPKNNPEAYLSENSRYSGVVYLTDERPIYSAATYSSYPMPKQGSPVVLEIDYKTNNYLNTGLLIRETSGYKKVPLVILNHSAEWNKIYINLGPNLSLHPQASEYRIYFEAGLDHGKTSSTIYLDNLKVIHRPI
jgi:hypothetical protein